MARAAGQYASKRIQRWWRGRMGRKRKRTGVVNVTRKQTRRFYSRQPLPARAKEGIVTFLLNESQLNVLNLMPARGNSPDERNQNYVDIIGIKVCDIASNTDANEPIVYHMAIIQAKYGLSGTVSDVEEDFFTNPRQATAGYTGIGFGNSDLTPTQRNCLSMYRGRWVIHCHKKWTLNTSNNGGRNGTMRGGFDTVYCEKYTKINKRYYLQGLNSDRPLLLCVWWNRLGGGTEPATATVERHVKVFFRSAN